MVVEDDGEYFIKHIVNRVGDRIRAVISDNDGHSKNIVITDADAFEAGRNLWIVRAGVYPSEL